MTSARKLKASSVSPVRCAIYTRKSTEEGLDQDFTSLDAQREAGEAYLHSQAHAGWTCLPQRYDDGGFSGSNLDRPALQRLLADIKAGQGVTRERPIRASSLPWWTGISGSRCRRCWPSAAGRGRWRSGAVRGRCCRGCCAAGRVAVP